MSCVLSWLTTNNNHHQKKQTRRPHHPESLSRCDAVIQRGGAAAAKQVQEVQTSKLASKPLTHSSKNATIKITGHMACGGRPFRRVTMLHWQVQQGPRIPYPRASSSSSFKVHPPPRLPPSPMSPRAQHPVTTHDTRISTPTQPASREVSTRGFPGVPVCQALPCLARPLNCCSRSFSIGKPCFVAAGGLSFQRIPLRQPAAARR